jgi:hypothetical protein
MSLFRKFQSSKLKVWLWGGTIDHKPFEIKVIAESIDDARVEVLNILDEIEVLKPEWEKLQNEKWTNDENGSLVFCEDFLKRLYDLEEKIGADFFNGNFALSQFDYHKDAIINDYYDDGVRLIDYILNSDPECKGRISAVSFSSCLDG